MANTFITADLIARESLPILKNNTVMPNLVYTDYSADYKEQGDTIQVRKPAVFTAIEFDGDVTGEEQTVTETKVDVKLDTIATIDVDVTSKELTLNIEDFNMQIVEPAMVALSEKIDQDLTGLYEDIPYFYGVSGTTPDELADMAGVRKVLMNNKTPNDGNIRLVVDENAEAEFLALDALVNVDKAGTAAALRDASLGRVYKMSIYMDQNIKTHTAGLYSALADVTITAGAAGATSIELTSAAGASTATLLKGDILTLDGNQYVVTADTAAAASGVIAAVSIYPALPVAFGDMGSAAVTFADVTAKAHVANLAFHRNAFALVNRPLMKPMGGADSYVTTAQGVINIRVTMGYNNKKKTNEISFDVLYGTKTLYPELAARLLG